MQGYLIRGQGKGKKARVHLWTGTDTVCRMWSTGGMRQQSKYSLRSDDGGHQVCLMCQAAQALSGEHGR